MIKTTVLFLILALLSTEKCNNTVSKNNTSIQYIEILDASYEKWTSGIKGGGMGREYFIKVKINSDSISFDSIWIDNKRLKVFVPQKGSIGSSYTKQKVFYPKGVVVVRASESSKLANKEFKYPIENSLRFALLRYFVNNKDFYLQIDTLIERKSTLKQ